MKANNRTNNRVKLSPSARTILRGALARHPDVHRHLPPGQKIKLLRKDELLMLAAKLNLDLSTMPHPAAATASGVGHQIHVLRDDGKFRFEGTIEFELKLELFGRLVTRRARVVWKNTPAWEFYDCERRSPVLGGGWSQMSMEVLVAPFRPTTVVTAEGEQEQVTAAHAWEPAHDLMLDGFLTNSIFDDIDDRIDRMCHEEDRLRRLAARQELDAMDVGPNTD